MEALRYPGPSSGFKDTEFAAAQTELVKELRWVGDVRAYMKDLSTPFVTENGLSSWANLTTITDRIKKALKPQQDQKTTVNILNIVSQVLKFGSKLSGPAAPVVSAVSSVYDLAVKYGTDSRGGNDLDTIGGNADELAAGAVDQLQAAQKGFNLLGNILVGDYKKLETVGTLGGCSASARNCPSEWRFSQRDREAASVAAYKSIEAVFDQSLMKLAFPAYLLPPRGNHTQARDYPCVVGFEPFYPFRDEPDNGQAALLQELPSNYDVLALGNVNNATRTYLIPNIPPREILDRMFGAAGDSLDPKAGGLGIYRPDYLRSASNDGTTFGNALKKKVGSPYCVREPPWSNR